MCRLVCRSAFAVAVLLVPITSSLAAPIPKAGEVSLPVVTAQALPTGSLLEMVREFVRVLAGAEATAKMDEALKTSLGEKGLAGLDLLRPIGGYATLEGTPDQWWGVIVVPITEEKAFLDLLQRAKYDVESVKDNAGLYSLDPTAGDLEIPVRLRIHDRHAYFGINAKDAALDISKLVPPAKLIHPAETAPFVARLDIAKLNPALKKQAMDLIDMGIAEAGAPPRFPEPFNASELLGVPVLKELKKFASRINDDGELLTVRLLADAKTIDISQEFVLTTKSDSTLAADIAALKPIENRFAGLLPNTAVGGGIQRLPLITPELRTAAEKLTNQLIAMWRESSVDEVKPVVDEIGKTILRTVKTRELDIAGGLLTPNKDGLHTAIAAVALDDPTGIETAFREALKNAPKLVQAAVKLDAAKIGEHSVHAVVLGPLLGADWETIFGKNATLHLVFGPKAVYGAMGVDALAELKRMIELKPGVAPLFDVRVNPKKIFDIVTAAGGFVPMNSPITTLDHLIPIQAMTVTGGKELRVRTTIMSMPWMGFRYLVVR